MSEGIEERLARLERWNKMLSYSILGAFVLVVGIIVQVLNASRSKVQDTLMAKNYVVVDGKGGKRATFGLTDKDEPFLGLTGSDNSRHVLISIRPEGPPFITLGDVNTYQHLSLYGPAPRSAGGIDFTWDTKHIAEMFVSPEGVSSLTLRNKEGQTVWKAP